MGAPDPYEQILVNEYKIPPDQARSMARRLKEGSIPDEGNIAGKVQNNAAKNELSRLASLKAKFEKFTDVAHRKAAGEPIDPGDEQFYQQVRSTHDQQMRDTAKFQDRADRQQLGDAADHEMQRMSNMRDYANGFRNGQNPEQLSPSGMSIVPAARPEMQMGPVSVANAPPGLDMGPVTVTDAPGQMMQRMRQDYQNNLTDPNAQAALAQWESQKRQPVVAPAAEPVPSLPVAPGPDPYADPRRMEYERTMAAIRAGGG